VFIFYQEDYVATLAEPVFDENVMDPRIIRKLLALRGTKVFIFYFCAFSARNWCYSDYKLFSNYRNHLCAL